MLITLKSDIRPPTAPVLGAPTSTGTTTLSIPLTTASTDLVAVASYSLERATSAGGTYTAISSAATFPYGDTGLSEGTTYYYRARATDSSGNVGNYSAIVSGTTQTTGTTINVTNVTQLMAAITTVNNVGGNRTIILADGTYTTPDAVYVNVPNVTIESLSGVRENVVIQGDAMSASAAVPFNVRIAANNLTLRNLTLGGRCRYSALQIAGESGANSGRVTNCVIRDSYEHLVKGSTNGSVGSTAWIIEDSLFSFTAGQAPAQYNGGIDVHRGTNWIVRRNTFRDIASPASSACQHAVNFWNGSTGTLIERNKIIDCDRGIGAGLNGNPANSNETIRNNQVYHSANSDAFADVGIIVENSTGARVYNNTVYFANSYPNAIEYRFTTTGCEIRNNLTNKAITARDGGTATLSNNSTNAQASWFVSVATGDLNLASAVSGVADAGETIASVTEDFGGTPRPQGSAYDRGADEYASSLLDLPLLQQNQISYLGSFNLPTTYGGVSFEGGYTGLGKGPPGELIVGAAWESARFARFTIPNIGGTAVGVGTVGTAQGTFANNARNFGGTFYHAGTNRIFYQRINSYDNEGNTAAVASCLADMTSHTTPRAVSTAFPMRGTIGYIGSVPPEWQSLVGGDCFMGGGPQSINSNTSCGPVFVAFNGANVSSGSGTLASTTLLGYNGGAGAAGTWIFYETNPVNGGAIIPGTRTMLYFGSEGETNSQYGQPPNVHGDQCLTGSGFHAYRYRQCFWAYDMRDLIDVKNGVKQRYEPRPYGTTVGPQPHGFYGWAAPGSQGQWGCTVTPYMSAFFDPTTMRIYTNERWSRTVNVFQITL